MRVMIVDDEKLARDEMRFLLEDEEDIDVVCEAASGKEALRLLDEQDVDLIFLDIQMPEMDGFQVVQSLLERKDTPLVIFATAYDNYAIRAFEVNALDYLLKPVEKSRLRKALDRARESHGEKRSFVERLKKLTQGIKIGRKFLNRLAMKRDGGLFLLDVDRIALLKQIGDRITAYTAEGTFDANYTHLDELEGELDPARFLRLGNEYIVNVERISGIVPWSGGNYLMTLDDHDKTEVNLTKSQAKVLKSRVEGIF